jgi:uncharacterized protein YbjT (DUF2867 family)
MILIAGGTGRLGTVLVDRLLNRGLDVRVLTRDPARAEHLAGDRLTVVSGDVRDRDSLVAATAGIGVVVSAVHGFTGPRSNSPAAVDRDGNAKLIDAAKAAGAEFVLISTVGAAADSPMELFRMKHAAEQHAASSGVPTTIIRATAFLELWIDLLNQTAARSGRPLVFGRGENPINFVSTTDVAALVELAVIDPTTRGKILEIGGPDDLSFGQLAQAVQAAAERTGAPRHVPRPVLHLMANTIGRLKPELGRQARAALAMDRSDLSFDTASIHRLYPDLPCTALADVLASSAEDTSATHLSAARS